MKLETKFDIGQDVYFMSKNKVQCRTVERIVVDVEQKNKTLQTEQTKISYFLRVIPQEAEHFQEDQLFATKQDLLNSL